MPHVNFHLFCADLLMRDSFKGHFLNERISYNDEGLFYDGSILNDLEHISGIKMHGRSNEFYQYILNKDRPYATLGLGMINHDLVDERYHPTLIKRKEKIIRKILEDKGFSIDDDRIPHRVTEFLIDYHIYNDNSENIWDIFIKRKNMDFSCIAFLLSGFFGKDQKYFKNLLDRWNDKIRIDDFEPCPDLYSKLEKTFNTHFPDTKIKLKPYLDYIIPKAYIDSSFLQVDISNLKRERYKNKEATLKLNV